MKLQVLNLPNGEFAGIITEVTDSDIFENTDWALMKDAIGAKGILVFEYAIEVVQ